MSLGIDFESLGSREGSDAIIVTDVEARVVYWNHAAERTFGYASAEAVGRALGEIIVPPDRVGEERRMLDETLARGSFTYESIRRCKSGALVYVDVSSRAIRDGFGSVRFVLFSKNDVTHLKVQRDTKFVEAKFRDLLESTPDAIVVANATGHIVLANRHAEKLFGYEHGELGGKAIENLLPSRLREAHIRHRAKYLSQPHVRSMGVGLELHGLRKDGVEIPVEISLSPLTTEEGALVMSAVRDISERRKAEQRFRGLLESAPDAMVIVSASGEIVLVNSQAERLFGYDRQELLNKPVEILVPERFRGTHVKHRAAFSLEPRARAMGEGLELFGLRRDGSEFPVEISLSPIESEEGALVSSAIRDITERKRIERVLQEKNVELQQAADAKDRFLANMSHELRTPLNAIIGFTGTLLMRLPGPLTVDQEKQLTTVQSSARHLLSLINDLLDVAKIDSGKLELNREWTSCTGVIDEVVTTLRPLAEKKGLSFGADLPAEDVVIHTDRRALSQIVINLVSNAIKYTDRGSVSIAVAEDTADRRALRRISVHDTGRGIEPAERVRLFQAFGQLDDSSTSRPEGTGLGLYLSRKLARLLGGDVTFESEYGKGSIFTLTLPRT